jgi:hypothetical protein
VLLQNPVETLGKEVEDVGGQSTAKPKNNVMEEFLLPHKSQQVPICKTDRNVLKGRLEIKFGHQRAWTRVHKVGNRMMERVLLDGSFRVGDPVIDGSPTWPQKVVDATNLHRVFVKGSSKQGASKMWQRW